MKKIDNTIPDILTDTEFQKLDKWNLLNHKAIRDFNIKNRYKQLRESMKSSLALETLNAEYPELQKQTLKKILYKN